MVAFIALMGMEIWLSSKRQTNRVHVNALVAASVDFHKTQCYFSSTLSLTTVILVRDIEGKGKLDSLDIGTFLIIATGGLIPIQLTLTCITRYGRQSWYLIMLSLVTTILASVTLVLYYSSIHFLIRPDRAPIQPPFQCTIHSTISEYLSPICGSDDMDRSYFSGIEVTNYWIWGVWVNSVAWLLFCIVNKACASPALRPYFTQINSVYTNCFPRLLTPTRFTRWISRVRSAKHTWTGIFAGTWSMAFGSQFYLFTIYFHHALISPRWTLGQVIAVTVWVPAVVEYIYIEFSKYERHYGCLQALIVADGIENASKYRYPSPLRVMELIAYQSVDIAMQGLPKSQEVKTSSPETQANGAFTLRTDSPLYSQEADQEENGLAANDARSI